MDVFGERLKCERVRLGLNQTEFAALGAVKQRAQYQYEKGLRRPNSDYLRAIALAGVDVWYVLTGSRTQTSGGSSLDFERSTRANAR